MSMTPLPPYTGSCSPLPYPGAVSCIRAALLCQLLRWSTSRSNKRPPSYGPDKTTRTGDAIRLLQETDGVLPPAAVPCRSTAKSRRPLLSFRFGVTQGQRHPAPVPPRAAAPTNAPRMLVVSRAIPTTGEMSRRRRGPAGTGSDTGEV
jgi:hypothetical protein